MNKSNMKMSEGKFEMSEEYDFTSGVRARFYEPKKISTSIRLDDDVVMFFKRKASEEKNGYQTLMNSALREAMQNRTRSE